MQADFNRAVSICEAQPQSPECTIVSEAPQQIENLKAKLVEYKKEADDLLLASEVLLAGALWLYFIDPDPGFEPISLTPPPDGSANGLALAYSKRW